MKGREIWLFTMKFPHGRGEAFIENELPFLAREASRVRIFPLEVVPGTRPLPEGVVVEPTFPDLYAAAGPWQMLRHLPTLAWVRRIIRSDAPSGEVFRGRWPDVRSRLRQALHRALWFRAHYWKDYDPERVVLYSYWTSDWATVLGMLKRWYPRTRFVTRMMGFDLYAHRARLGWQALQAFHLLQADRVYAISQAGLAHLRERHPEHADKYRLSHLATLDHGQAPWSPSPTLRVVSCSNLVGLKRVHLIAEALAGMPGEVEWTHFGDGPERERVEERVRSLPGNVRVDLKGSTPNREVIAWYQRHPVDLFVHPSETEGGAPVALQEATSFGIPVIGCDAGGVPEVVTPRTGTLLPVDIGPEDLAGAMQRLRSELDRGAISREQVRAHWEAHFRADRVHAELARELVRG